MAEFLDEEGYGKYLDLHECHTRFINLKGMDVRHFLFYIYIWPASREKGPSDITNSVHPDQPLHNIENSYT